MLYGVEVLSINEVEKLRGLSVSHSARASTTVKVAASDRVTQHAEKRLRHGRGRVGAFENPSPAAFLILPTPIQCPPDLDKKRLANTLRLPDKTSAGLIEGGFCT